MPGCRPRAEGKGEEKKKEEGDGYRVLGESHSLARRSLRGRDADVPNVARRQPCGVCDGNRRRSRGESYRSRCFDC